jgi:hypothetical protein
VIFAGYDGAPDIRHLQQIWLYDWKADGGIRTLDPRFTSQLKRGNRRILKGPLGSSMPCKPACSEIPIGNGRTRGLST